MKVRAWDTQDGIISKVDDALLMDQMTNVDFDVSDGVDSLKVMIAAIAAGGRDGLRSDSPMVCGPNGQALPAMESLSQAGLIKLEGRSWHVQPMGQSCITLGRAVSAPRVVLRAGTEGTHDMNTYQLLVHMLENGWHHRVVKTVNRKKHVDYDCSVQDQRKVFYTKVDKAGISRWYLLALLTASEREPQPIQHFRTDKYYESVITGRPLTVTRRQRLPLQLFPEDEWPDDEAVRAPRRRPVRRQRPQPMADDPETSSSTESSSEVRSLLVILLTLKRGPVVGLEQSYTMSVFADSGRCFVCKHNAFWYLQGPSLIKFELKLNINFVSNLSSRRI